MRIFDKDVATGLTEGSLQIFRWEQFADAGRLPFGVMWYSVAPDSASPVDQHPEVELSIVLRGDAAVEVAGEVTVVRQGSAFLLDGSEAHVIHNRSATEPLDILSAYWMPKDGPADSDG